MSEARKLYTESDLQMMRVAEEARMPGKSRVEEIKNFARLSGFKRIGIAYCVALRKEATRLREMLEEEFEVFSIDCFKDRITSSELLGTNAPGISCNPAGQADYLNENSTELNISFGLCMGHDIVFNQKSKAPVTTLIVKDREHNHNPYKEFEKKE
jgi:uncharacterized metal-binding protein